MDGIYVAVGQYNVVHAFGDGLFGFLAQAVKRSCSPARPLETSNSIGSFTVLKPL